MTSQIGAKKEENAFTLIEVLITAAILSLATVVIAQSNLMNLSVYGRYANKVGIQNFAEEKIWEAKESILSSQMPETGKTSGTYKTETREYQWQIETSEVVALKVYTISLVITWLEGGDEKSISRYSFVPYQTFK